MLLGIPSDSFVHGEVEVVFLSRNATSLIHPLDQGVIRCFKVAHLKLTFSRLINTMDADPVLGLTARWKSFSNAHCITDIKQALGATNHG
ncbi:transposable element-derived 1-like [Podarcis lilfordi]|uniref:Transposable element-derived 1-like n=1 Tax=Podarcis lilfordi TaxID=74358 RepID=A0AA35K2U3_9SAUR|nr:transposable element-derived 1-like [Podarcis lilfordi]